MVSHTSPFPLAPTPPLPRPNCSMFSSCRTHRLKRSFQAPRLRTRILPTPASPACGFPETAARHASSPIMLVTVSGTPARLNALLCLVVCDTPPPWIQVRMRIVQKRRQMFGSQASLSSASVPPGEKLDQPSVSSRRSSGGFAHVVVGSLVVGLHTAHENTHILTQHGEMPE